MSDKAEGAIDDLGGTSSELDSSLGVATDGREARTVAAGTTNRAQTALVALVALVIAGALPHAVEGITLRLATLAVIWYVAVLGLQVLMGQAGLISIGQAAFVGIGAYTSGLLAVRAGLSFWITLPVAAIVAAVIALFVGVPTLKLRSHYLAIATVGVGEITYLLLLNLQSVTNGADGVPGIPSPIGGSVGYFYLAAGIAAAVTLAVHLLRRSPVGLAFNAVKTDEFAASSMGVAIGFHTMLAFVIAAVCGGIAGALFAHYEGFISPSAFALQQSILLLTMIVIGGTNHISGALIGAVLITFLPEYLRDSMGQSYLVMYGVAVLVVVLFAPLGISGVIGSLKERVSQLIRASDSQGRESSRGSS